MVLNYIINPLFCFSGTVCDKKQSKFNLWSTVVDVVISHWFKCSSRAVNQWNDGTQMYWESGCLGSWSLRWIINLLNNWSWNSLPCDSSQGTPPPHTNTHTHQECPKSRITSMCVMFESASLFNGKRTDYYIALFYTFHCFYVFVCYNVGLLLRRWLTGSVGE